MSNTPDPPRLFMALVPMTLGVDMLTYAPITLATNRPGCWDRALEWADESRRNASMFRRLYGCRPLLMTTPTRRDRSMTLWDRYNPYASRAARIAWLRRHGCRVVAGTFIPR